MTTTKAEEALDRALQPYSSYGQPLPIDPADAALYGAAEALGDRLRAQHALAARRAWEIDMAVRAYRIAETAAERDAARVRLVADFERLNRFSPLDQGDPTPNYSFAEYAEVGGRHDVV